MTVERMKTFGTGDAVQDLGLPPETWRLYRAMEAIQRLAAVDCWFADSVACIAGVSVHTANSLLLGRPRGCTLETAEAVLAAMRSAYLLGSKVETRRVPLPRRKP